ncbi:MAG: hypothetical protein AB8B69_24350, partial [Chitinophagales bacterium]
MKTFFELVLIAATLFIFTACSQSSANENQGKLSSEKVEKAIVSVEKTAPSEMSAIPKTSMTFASMTHDF